MRCQALSVGVQVPIHHFSGTVHSVFHHACNLWLEPGMLLTLLPSQKGNVPHGIRLHTPPEFTFVNLVQVGQPVACRGGILRTGGSAFSVDLRSARPWHIDLQELHIDLRQYAQAHSWAIAWCELKTFRRRSGLSKIPRVVSPSKERSYTPTATEVFLQPSIHTISALLQATKDFQSEDARASIMPLIGRGPGLTPSGDDFLVGYLAGLWSTACDSPSRRQFLAALKAEIPALARNTNEISCAYLRSAVKGHIAEPIAKLAQQLKQANDMMSVRVATQAALQVGHTSGPDGVLGLLLGCLAWQSPALHLLDESVLFN
ncbi:MAG: DUF2877 domain-containing protein [Nitrospira sp.]|nr:DUF2877 domain-containing protein [Nitrospira sp.]